MIYKLDKTVVSVKGNAEKFLQGLTTNMLTAPRNAFVNMHGRIIATFDQVRGGDDEFLLVIASAAWETLKAHTDRYARLSKTTIEPTALNVYFDFKGDYPVLEGDHTIPQRSGRIIVTPRVLESNVTDEAFTSFRLQHNIPLHMVDYRDDFILNVDDHEFVSYTKGCFLGQEPVAKVHNRSKPTWRLEVSHDNGHPVAFVFVKNM